MFHKDLESKIFGRDIHRLTGEIGRHLCAKLCFKIDNLKKLKNIEKNLTTSLRKTTDLVLIKSISFKILFPFHIFLLSIILYLLIIIS